MIRVNKKHSVEYRNGYYLLREHGVSEKSNEYTKQDKTYPNIGAMIMQCGFEMSYEYTDAALKSKDDYERDWNNSFLAAREKRLAKADKLLASNVICVD